MTDMFGLMFGFSTESRYRPIPKDEHDAEAIQRSPTSSRIKRVCLTIVLSVSLVMAILVYTVVPRPITSSMSSCTSPRLRREWRTLSTVERHEYLNAVQCLYDQPSKLFDAGRLTDDFAWVHVMNSFDTHYKPTFLLWHRYFISLYESMLREKCGYSGSLPYWEWALDWEDPPSSPVWDAETGFGGDGDGEGEEVVHGGSCVRDGPFTQYQVRYINNVTRPHCLSRGFRFKGQKFAPDLLDGLYSHDKLAEFSLDLEKHSHDAIPNGVGGDFATFTAPSDPIWFLHHSNIDRLFWKWQQSSSARVDYQALKGESEAMSNSLNAPMPMLSLAEELPALSVVDTRSGILCYSYS